MTTNALHNDILQGLWQQRWSFNVWHLVMVSTINTKPIFFKPKTHAYEHHYHSHPWPDPLSNVYVWIDGSGSDYFWAIWWICCFVLGCFFFFFFWEKSWLGCWWLNNGFWCGGAYCWWRCGWERERERGSEEKWLKIRDKGKREIILYYFIII